MGLTKWEELKLVDNKQGPKKRFELHIGDQVAFIDYIINKQGIIYLTHTEVPVALEGQGVGSAIVSKVLEHIRTEGLKMAPLCPFVAVYLKRHPEAAEGIMAPGFSIG